MKQTLRSLLLVFLLLPLVQQWVPAAHAQPRGSWLWGRANTGAGIEAYAVATDRYGNVYAAGVNFEDSAMHFGGITLAGSSVPGTSGGMTNGIQAVWVKYDRNGTPLWADGTRDGDAFLYNITTDAAGNLLVFGSFDSPVLTIGGTTLTNTYGSAGESNFFIAKYSPTGTLLWAVRDGNAPNTYYCFFRTVSIVPILTTGGVVTDAAGNIYVTSDFRQPAITIGTTTLTNADPGGAHADIFIAKYTASGAFVWAQRAGGASDDFVFGIGLGSGGSIYVAGAFWSDSVTVGASVIRNPYGGSGYGPTAGLGIVADTPLAYVAEFSPTGTPLWAEAAGGRGGAYATGVVTDATGNVYITGGFGDTSITIGTTTLTRTYPAAVPHLALYVAQLSPAHAVTWAKTIGSPWNGVWGYSIALAKCGALWVSGSFSENADMDGHILGSVWGQDPIFIAGYNLSGGVIGYAALPAGSDDQNSIACDSAGNVYVCADFFDVAGSKFGIGPDTMIANMSERLYVGKYSIRPPGSGDTIHSFMDTAMCNSPGITLSGPLGYSSYLWENAATAQGRYISATGTYWVVSTGVCNLPVAIDSFRVVLAVSDTEYHSMDTSVCSSAGDVTLSSDTGYTKYMWNNGAAGAQIIVSYTGTYWVREIADCHVRYDTFNLEMRPVPDADPGKDTVLCAGKEITLHCAAPPGATVRWNNGSTGPLLAVSKSGTYSVTVNDRGCINTGAVTVKFDIPPGALIHNRDTSLCDETQYRLESGNSNTVWSTGQTGPGITVQSAGIYIATASNDCGTVSDTVKIDFANCLVLVPSAFTPNNDGRNDVFKVVGLLLHYYDDFSLHIFNRYGQRVYYTNDIRNGWNGTYDGIPQDVGTYFYMVSYKLNGARHMMKGDFELVR